MERFRPFSGTMSIMKRRIAALVLTLCLLSSGFSSLAAPQIHLVCRLSGQPMIPIFEAVPKSAQTASCCCVHISQSIVPSSPTYALQPGSCCVLHVAASHGPLPPSNLSPPFALSLALVPTRAPDAPRPIFAVRAFATLFTGQAAPPRAPPAYPVSGRAPPLCVFS